MLIRSVALTGSSDPAQADRYSAQTGSSTSSCSNCFTPPPAPYVFSIPHHPALLPPPPALGRDGQLWLQAPPTSTLSAEEQQHDCVEETNGELSAGWEEEKSLGGRSLGLDQSRRVKGGEGPHHSSHVPFFCGIPEL